MFCTILIAGLLTGVPAPSASENVICVQPEIANLIAEAADQGAMFDQKGHLVPGGERVQKALEKARAIRLEILGPVEKPVSLEDRASKVWKDIEVKPEVFVPDEAPKE